MYNINKEKMNKIQKADIVNSGRYLGEKKMTKEILTAALGDALEKIDKLWNDVHGNFSSEMSKDNVYWEVDNTYGWHSGFWTGMLWLAYEATGDEKWRERALSHIPSYEKRIDEQIDTNHHDMGFVYIPSCVAAYKLTGDEQAKRAAIKAADNLKNRYIEEGKFIQAWGNVGQLLKLIIDCMNNIPLLFWAAHETGDNDYYAKAYNHLVTTVNNIVREDASTFHTYFIHPDGTPDRGATVQGVSDDSCWARGQAWIVSGLPISYKYTQNEEIPELFEKVANYYINHLPEDFVPYWDMTFGDGSGEDRDSSAGSIAVCGFLEMLPHIKDKALRDIYEGVVDRIMYSLYTNYSTKDTPESNGLLLHAVYSKPGNRGIDECNLWGCYYYMEALVRMTKGTKAYW